MLHSRSASTIRLNDADNAGYITYHQWLALIQACNEPSVREAYRDGVESGASSISLLSFVPESQGNKGGLTF